MNINRRIVLSIMLLLCAAVANAQNAIRGMVYDKQTAEPLGFVTVQLMSQTGGKLAGGTMTSDEGRFRIDGLKAGRYTLVLSYVGYRDVRKDITLNSSGGVKKLDAIYMSEDSRQLQEVQVTGLRTSMKLEVDRKSFDVSQLITSEGQAATDLLDNIPSVEVDNDGNISLRGNTSVEVWINGKPSGLNSDNRSTILEQLPAETIERIEVIDNPSAKFSAEGSAGIINIVLKKQRDAGYYGSIRAGGSTNKGANTAVNFNYNSSLVDVLATVGYRHNSSKGHVTSEQNNYDDGALSGYNNYDTANHRQGNSLFSRLGATLHASAKDDISFTGMLMTGGSRNTSVTPYYYGSYAADGTTFDNYVLNRTTTAPGHMLMMHGEIGYTHEFAEKHKLDFNFSASKWDNKDHSFYRDFTDYSTMDTPRPSLYTWQYRPQNISNRSYELKLDYENQITDKFKVESGYNWNASRENTPQYSYEAEGEDKPAVYDLTDPDEDYSAYEEHSFFNRFIYNLDVHALYVTAQYNFGKFGLMGGLRGEYWHVNTESLDWDQEHGVAEKDAPFKKDYFQLFPSVFASYQLTPNDQLQLNYTRRLRRPWGGQLNSFRDTRDATMISFGNPLLTPEYSNSFSFNYLRTWTEHSMLISLYYRPTSDVMQKINYRDLDEDIMYSTTMNVAKSTSAGAEITVKNTLFRILELSTNINAYYYKLDAFTYDINNQTVEGEAQTRFTWNVRIQASVMLPYGITVQANGRYNSRQAITQGYRPAMCFVDLGVRKSFLNKMFTLTVNCRDLFDSRAWKNVTHSDTYWRHQINRRNSRNVFVTLTYNFGNQKAKKPSRGKNAGNEESDFDSDEE
ncbi:MAG: TonB-dependent receptor [Prevotella sp.]|nr:TonB-dependent receptor [Prevotella sp.]